MTQVPIERELLERELFEAHIAKDCGDLSTFGSGPNMHYCNSGVNHEWIGWKTRAALLSAPALPDHIPDAGKMVAAMPVGELTDSDIRKIWSDICAEWADKGGNPYLKYARAILAAARTQTVREPMQWLPIETAPKYKEVLVYRDDSGPFIAKLTTPDGVLSDDELAEMNFPDDFEEWFSDAYGWQEKDQKPTHWMPLPAAHGITKKGGE